MGTFVHPYLFCGSLQELALYSHHNSLMLSSDLHDVGMGNSLRTSTVLKAKSKVNLPAQGPNPSKYVLNIKNESGPFNEV